MVMIDPQTVNPLALPSVPLSMRSQLPNTPCVYFAIDSQNAIQYVGRARNLQRRWKQHHRQQLLEDIGEIRIAWLAIDNPEILPEIEIALIDWLKPLLNRTSVIFSGKEARTSTQASGQSPLLQSSKKYKAGMIPLEFVQRLVWNKQFGARLKQARENVSRQKLIEKLHGQGIECSVQYLRKLEDGNAESISLHLLLTVCQSLDISLGRIVPFLKIERPE